MNAPINAPRTISDVNVIEFNVGIRITWLDETGLRCTATRFGLTANRLINDLHVATLISENARSCFLIGWIRGLADSGGLDD